MGQPMQEHRVESGVGEHHLGPRLGSRIAGDNGINLLAKVLEHRTIRHDMIRPLIGCESRCVSLSSISETLLKESSILLCAHEPTTLNPSLGLGLLRLSGAP